MRLSGTEILTYGWLALIGLVFLFGFLLLLIPLRSRRVQIRRILRKLPTSEGAEPGEEPSTAQRRAMALLTALPWLREPARRFERAWREAKLPGRSVALEAPALGEFLSAQVLLPRLANRRLARALPATLVALGILGTFLGLVLSLPAIGTIDQGTAAEAGDQARQLQQLLGTVIDGLNLAFWTSIFGIGLSVLFGVTDRFWTYALERAVSDLSQETREVFPVMSAGELARKHHELIEDAVQSARTVGTDVATALNNAFETHMQPAMSAIQGSVNELVEFASTEQIAGVETLVGTFMESMNEAMGDQFEELRGVLESTVSSQERMGAGLREFNEQLEQSARTQGSLIEETRRAAETLSQSLDRLESISRLLGEAADDVMSAGAQLNESAAVATRSQQAALEAQRQLSEAAESHAAAMQRARDDLIEAWDAAAKQAQGTIHQIQEATRELSEGIGDQLVAALEKFDGALAETIDRFGGTLAQVDGPVGELPPAAAAMRESAEAMRAHSKEVEAGLSRLEKLVTGLVADNVETAAAAASDLKASVDVARSTTSDIRDLARELSTSVQDVAHLRSSLKETDGALDRLSTNVSDLRNLMEGTSAPLDALAGALDGGGNGSLRHLTSQLRTVAERLESLRTSIEDASGGGSGRSWFWGRRS